MLKNTMGLILADHKRVSLGDLTGPRALAAVPFGGRYRIIDFILSNMVNSGVTNVGVVAQTKYKSLLDHIGTGASWDLDRMKQGLSILPPYINSSYFDTESGDLTGLYEFVIRGKEEFVVISESNFITNTDLDELVSDHEASNADMTVAYIRDGQTAVSPVYSLDLERGVLKDMLLDSADTAIQRNAIGLLAIRRELLLHLLSRAIARGQNEFSVERLLRLHKEYKIRGYEFQDICLRINSVSDYGRASMRLLDRNTRVALFDQPSRPIYTKVKNESPAEYLSANFVSNSLISDGCRISGSIIDSVIFRGVQVLRHSNLQNCIIFQDAVIGEGADLHYVILDKNATIRPGVKLQGQPDYPLVIKKGAVV